MSLIYDTVLRGADWLASLTAGNKKNDSKLSQFVNGQKDLIETIRCDLSEKPGGEVVWVHAASLGEYAVVRPLVQKLKTARNCQILFTFFSPTGYEHLRQSHPLIDYLYYLPLDTPANAKAFVEAVRPKMAFFAVSEFWLNYLSELKKHGIPTYLISAKINRDSQFFKWYGKSFRKSLDAFTRIYAIDESSLANLRLLGYDRATITGNPLFDNAWEKAAQLYSNAIVERFAKGNDVFIAGSIHDKKDLKLVSELANNHRDTKFIFVPHAITADMLADIRESLQCRVAFYGECDENTDFTNTHVLVIDYLGDLAYLYRYARYAYVGGGFTPYLHSLIEAAVYGMPVAFGPRIERKVTPTQLVERGIGQIVTTGRELDQWFSVLKNNEKKLLRIKKKATDYVQSNIGAADRILYQIMSELPYTKI